MCGRNTSTSNSAKGDVTKVAQTNESINIDLEEGFRQMPMSEMKKAQIASFQLQQANLPQFSQPYAGVVSVSQIIEVRNNKWRTGVAYDNQTVGKGKGDKGEHG